MTVVENLLTVNDYSRPGRQHAKVLALIMHWTAVPNQAAIEVRNFFESRKSGTLGYGSAHYIVDLGGTIIRCIPEAEVAYHVGSTELDPASKKIYTDWARTKFGTFASNPETSSPNGCTLGIEMCPIDDQGNFNQATTDAAVELVADICRRLELDPMSDIATHNMVVGWKDCPRLWVNHPEKLQQFKQAVKEA
jgi:N-acetylmuramoyl-L-alanine amidase